MAGPFSLGTALTPRWLDALLRQLAAGAPERAVLLAPEGHPIVEVLRQRLPQVRVRRAAPPDPAEVPAERLPLVVVAGLLERMAAAAARELLAALRDRQAQHTILWVDLERSPLPEAELRALGFRVHARDGAHLLCGFDAYDYKDRPDWLNPRHWAHPELWDRYRW